jgi:hypothetical protein
MGLSSQCVIKRELRTSAALGSHKLARRFVATLTEWKPKVMMRMKIVKCLRRHRMESHSRGRFDFGESHCRSARL